MMIRIILLMLLSTTASASELIIKLDEVIYQCKLSDDRKTLNCTKLDKLKPFKKLLGTKI